MIADWRLQSSVLIGRFGSFAAVTRATQPGSASHQLTEISQKRAAHLREWPGTEVERINT
jgi:hypothetical protein